MTLLRAHSVTQNGRLSLWTADNVQNKLLRHKTFQEKQYSLTFSTVQAIFFIAFGALEKELQAFLGTGWEELNK